MLITAPERLSRICGSTRHVSVTGPQRFTSNTRTAEGDELSDAAANNPTPALLIRMSIPPYSAVVAATALRQTPSSVMSPTVHNAPPSSYSGFSRDTSIRDKRAPRRRNSCAQAAPIPSRAPVIRTTLSFNRSGTFTLIVPGRRKCDDSHCPLSYGRYISKLEKHRLSHTYPPFRRSRPSCAYNHTGVTT